MDGLFGPSRPFVFAALTAIHLGNLRALYSIRSLSFVNFLGPRQVSPYHARFPDATSPGCSSHMLYYAFINERMQHP